MIDLVIITGVSGAGKSTALTAFEESGYYVVDNIPLAVAENLFEEFSKHEDKYSKVAVSVSLKIASDVFDLAKKFKNFTIDFMGLDCSDAVLMERFRLSRRLHPRQAAGLTLAEAMKEDTQLIDALRDKFTYYVDTSKITKNELRKIVYKDVIKDNGSEFTIMFVSFGYKRSVPQDIETVFDVRLLPNPYWVPELKNLTGKDEKVIKYIFDAPETKEFLEHVISYLTYYLKKLKESGRRHAYIGVACSGGQHRSVAIADYLYKYFSKDYSVSVSHRDLPR